MLNTKDFYTVLDNFYQNRDFNGAFSYMLEVQKDLNTSLNKELSIALSNELGAMYRVRGKTDLALKEYDNALKLLTDLGLSGSKNYANALVNLGNVYTAMGDFENAYQTGLQALKIMEHHSDTQYEIATLSNNLSIVLRELGKLDEGMTLAKKAIEIISAMPDKEVEKATSYVNLGQLEAKSGDLFSARQTLTHANSLFEKIGIIDDFHYIVSVHTIAEIDELEGHLHPALDGYKKARFLYERNFGKTKYFDHINKCIERVEFKLDEY